VCLAVIPGNTELDLKALSRLTGDRRVELAPLKDVQPLTGYIRGGVTALAGKKDHPVFIDETCEADIPQQMNILTGGQGGSSISCFTDTIVWWISATEPDRASMAIFIPTNA
jgi:Cys-tRNA(Pro)/Cys-tRNA(Cys) deacylase